MRGGNADGVYRDYVELYNPTSTPISLDGMSLQYFAAKGTTGNRPVSLTGTIEPGGYVLIQGANDSHTTEITPDIAGSFSASGTSGSMVLFSETGAQTLTNPTSTVGMPNVIDAVGWGTAGISETATVTGTTTGSTSYQRTNFVDTDNNSADFVIADATPQTATPVEPTDPPTDPVDPPTDPVDPPTDPVDPPTDPVDPPTEPTDPPTDPVVTITPIRDIQGTGDATPLKGQTVTTQGVVTAVYPTGGFAGYYIQTPGTGGTAGAASDGVFVYGLRAGTPEIGDYVQVTGVADEYNSLTQVRSDALVQLDKTGVVAPTPVALASVPTVAEREALEGMLVTFTGDLTVTDNYNTGRYGSVGLAGGMDPLAQPSDVTADPAAAAALTAANADRAITLDDGSSWDYTTFSRGNDDIPVPWLDVKDPIRVGAQVRILQPMILDYRFQWNLQPVRPVNTLGAADASAEYIDITGNERPAAPGDFGADVTVSSFNVLNFFTDLGANEVGCVSYTDRDGADVTTKSCDVRGASTQEAMDRQLAKIVAAINGLDSSVVGLEEIETSSKFGHDRDATLKVLVDALNAAAGSEKWAYVPSPAALPADEDVIRLAFIYQPAEVAPIGESKILIGNEYFTGVAREPLAQTFQAIGADGDAAGVEFTVVGNHFKSKGSLSTVFPDDTDVYQGNNFKLRAEQARQLLAWIEAEYAGKPVFIIGDLNSYSKEDTLAVLEAGGYANIAELYNAKYTYQYSSLVGSLDHALANAEAQKLLVGAEVWNINSVEPLAFEYSRYNYNVKFADLFDLTAFRSSDHDPIKFGLNTLPEVGPTPDPTDEPTVDPTDEPTVDPTDEPTVDPTDDPTDEPTKPPVVKPPFLGHFIIIVVVSAHHFIKKLPAVSAFFSHIFGFKPKALPRGPKSKWFF